VIQSIEIVGRIAVVEVLDEAKSVIETLCDVADKVVEI